MMLVSTIWMKMILSLYGDNLGGKICGKLVPKFKFKTGWVVKYLSTMSYQYEKKKDPHIHLRAWPLN